jgi:hypothetical protein
MPFIEHNDVIEQVTSTVANPTLCNAVLPRASEAGALWPDAETLDGVNNFFIELCAAIEDQVLGNWLDAESRCSAKSAAVHAR